MWYQFQTQLMEQNSGIAFGTAVGMWETGKCCCMYSMVYESNRFKFAGHGNMVLYSLVIHFSTCASNTV